MALQTPPVAEWTDEAVLGYVLNKGDHILLRTADFDVQDYEKTRKALKTTGSKSKPETVGRLKQEHLQAKRPLLSKLRELRADRAKAQCEELLAKISLVDAIVIRSATKVGDWVPQRLGALKLREVAKRVGETPPVEASSVPSLHSSPIASPAAAPPARRLPPSPRAPACAAAPRRRRRLEPGQSK